MIRTTLKQLSHKLALALGAHRWLWRSGLSSELKFWDRYLGSGGLQWKDDFARRLDPALPLQPRPARALKSHGSMVVDILDVGAGPLTYLGKALPGHDLRITAVDPLADGYAELMQKHNVKPPVLTQFARGEELEAKFAANSFDLVFARNCIDHSENPMQAIEQMVRVTRPGGCVLLEHWPNEGVEENYRGLHQWNFDCQNDRFIIWNARQRVDVAELFAGKADVTCAFEQEEGKPMVIAQLRKK
jgi:SAM-dependent methyltransferase